MSLLYLYKNKDITLAQRVLLGSINAIYARKYNRPLIWINIDDDLDNFDNFIEHNVSIGVFFDGSRSRYYNQNSEDEVVYTNLSKLLLTIYKREVVKIEGFYKTVLNRSIYRAASAAIDKNVVIIADDDVENVFRNVFNFFKPLRVFDYGISAIASYEEFLESGGNTQGIVILPDPKNTPLLIDFSIYNRYFIGNLNDYRELKDRLPSFSIIFGKPVEPEDPTILSLNCLECENLLCNYLFRTVDKNIRNFTKSIAIPKDSINKNAHYITFVHDTQNLSSIYNNNQLFKEKKNFPINWSIPEFYTYYNSIMEQLIKTYKRKNAYILNPRDYKKFSFTYFADLQKYIDKTGIKHILVHDLSERNYENQMTITNFKDQLNGVQSLVYLTEKQFTKKQKVDDMIIFNGGYELNNQTIKTLQSLPKDISQQESYSVILIKPDQNIEEIRKFVEKLPSDIISVNISEMVDLMRHNVSFNDNIVETESFFYKLKNANILYIILGLSLFIYIFYIIVPKIFGEGLSVSLFGRTS